MEHATASVNGRSSDHGQGQSFQIQKYLSGVDYPASKEDLIEHAKDHGADDRVRKPLQDIPDQQYQTPADVSQAIGKLE